MKYSTRLDTYRDLRNDRVGEEEWQDAPPYEPIVTSYFRLEFQSAGGDAYRSLKLRIKADAGVVVYLNGTEIYRNGLPRGDINYETPGEPVDGARENFFVT